MTDGPARLSAASAPAARGEDPAGGPATRAEDLAALERSIGSRRAGFAELADRIWQEPELRWREHAAVDAMTAVALQEGLAVERSVAGLPTAFTAEGGDGGPLIAILGEYDALAGLSQEAGATERRPQPGNQSGNGHGCGHHLLGSAALLAVAAVRDRLAEAGLSGRVRFYGCPAEEAAAGKTFMVARGAFDDVDAVLTWHPGDRARVMSDLSLAYFQARLHFRGRAAHASLSPEAGRSALDAAELTSVGVNYLREHMQSHARVHGALADAGGDSPNVVQERAEAFYLVRAPTVPQARELYDRVVRVAEGAALMTDTSVAAEIDGATSELLPSGPLELLAQEILEEVGAPGFDDADRARATGFGAGLAADVEPPAAGRAQMAFSTDVGDVSWVAPTVQVKMPCWALGTEYHSWQAVAQGKLPAAHKGMAHAALALGGIALELLRRPERLGEAVAAHAEQVAAAPYECPLPDGLVPPPLRAAETG